MFHHCNHLIVQPFENFKYHCRRFVKCHLLASNSKLVEIFLTNQQVLAVVATTKKNCLRIFATSLRLISAMTENQPWEGGGRVKAKTKNSVVSEQIFIQKALSHKRKVRRG